MNPSLNLIAIRGFSAIICSLAILSGVANALPEDRNQAAHISANKQEVDLKRGEVVYLGDVKLVQGTLEVNAQKVTIHKDKSQVEESFTAEGSPARYQQRPEAGKPIIHAEASTIYYNFKTEKLVLDKNVSIEQDGAVTKAGHADYDTKSQMAKFSAGEGTASGRVETVIPAKTDTEKKE